MGTVHDPATRAPGPDELNDVDVSVEAAAVLLSLAMRDTEQPASDLGVALARLSARVRSPVEGSDVATLRRELDALRSGLSGDISVCIESLQFHDRLVQQLAAVRSFLASLGKHQPWQGDGGLGAQRWEELLRLVRGRLTSDSRHQIFDLLLRTGALDAEVAGELVADGGSVELF
jgi:hypothetical protein